MTVSKQFLRVEGVNLRKFRCEYSNIYSKLQSLVCVKYLESETLCRIYYSLDAKGILNSSADGFFFFLGLSRNKNNIPLSKGIHLRVRKI